MTREIHTGEGGGGQQGTSLINRQACVDSNVPSCHRGLIDGAESPVDSQGEKACEARWLVHACPRGRFGQKAVSLRSGFLKPHEMHSFCLLSVAAVINPSLLPWGMAGGTIISLRSKAGDFTLCFIIRRTGQVFWKAWVIVVLIGIDGVTSQPSTYSPATLTSPNEVINSPAKQNLPAIW